jgi:4,5-dihydroxyphthalate decarboxylase
MTGRTIQVAVGRDYDRTRLLTDAEAAAKWGVSCSVLPNVHDAFRVLVEPSSFDAGEMSTAFYTALVAAGPQPFVALPIFISRAFRYGNVFVRRDADLHRLEDLKGTSIGLPEYGMTMGVWIRGMLSDGHGVAPQDVHWVTAREPVLTPTSPRVAELGIRVTHLEGADLWARLANGELEAAIGRPPAGEDGDMPFRRLLSDFGHHDLEYLRATRNFPIMHTLVVRRSLCEEEPAAVAAIFEAMCAAKKAAMTELEDSYGTFIASLPFLAWNVEQAQAELGANWWAYGVEANRGCLATLMRYCHEQGVTDRPMDVDELFWPGSVGLVDPG